MVWLFIFSDEHFFKGAQIYVINYIIINHKIGILENCSTKKNTSYHQKINKKFTIIVMGIKDYFLFTLTYLEFVVASHWIYLHSTV